MVQQRNKLNIQKLTLTKWRCVNYLTKNSKYIRKTLSELRKNGT